MTLSKKLFGFPLVKIHKMIEVSSFIYVFFRVWSDSTNVHENVRKLFFHSHQVLFIKFTVLLVLHWLTENANGKY